ncbi:hypothetical protein EJ05DRAFT_495571 [Pseudovirgaria hyperparasitica]|uniref:Uncharacterized protein n=1 Tax=Pseudovirgaria hyperparasitica TaxID=470096 RepID=A0A6A6WKL1_9PEZI|nr:uncharacterized protein EJ05DRAFT_495571 [Pseudovirgaria hyperparasitica]KAF2762707.1 hypothetical protein EJ05DRAFT_495571 [Pseudovirgaria hyperparasitica]
MKQKSFRNLREYLTQQNPTVQYEDRGGTAPVSTDKTNSKSQRKNSKWPTPKALGLWTEFQWASLSATMDRRLQQALERDMEDLHDFSYIQPPFLTFRDENALESIFIKFHQSIVIEALDKTPNDLIGHRVRMVRGGQARRLYEDESPWPHTPDWAGVCLKQDDSNILPGESKHNWGFREISDVLSLRNHAVTLNEGHKKDSRLSPISQIMWYCALAHARYGYIISNSDLIVIRVDFSEMKNLKAKTDELRQSILDTGKVQLQAIPWKESGVNTNGDPKMTILLALWSLHIMAANEGRLARTKYCNLKKEKYVSPDEQVISEKEMSSFDSSLQGLSQDSQRHSQGLLMSQVSNASHEGAKMPKPRTSRTSMKAEKRTQEDTAVSGLSGSGERATKKPKKK